MKSYVHTFIRSYVHTFIRSYVPCVAIIAALSFTQSCTPTKNTNNTQTNVDPEYLDAMAYIDHLLEYSKLNGANGSSVQKISEAMNSQYQGKSLTDSASLKLDSESKDVNGMISIAGEIQNWLGKKKLSQTRKKSLSIPFRLPYNISLNTVEARLYL